MGPDGIADLVSGRRFGFKPDENTEVVGRWGKRSRLSLETLAFLLLLMLIWGSVVRG
jgi:hypothetical protein